MPPPEFLQPLIDLFPAELREFLNGGGWLALAAAAALLLLLVLAAFLRSAVRRRKPKRPAASPFLESLADYPPPLPSRLPQRLLLRNLPVRVRLVVLAPLGHGAGTIDMDEIEPLLNGVTPGLGKAVSDDQPRVRIWPTQLSYAGFVASFRRDTVVPGEAGEPSNWVLVAGRALVKRRPFVVGLALWSEEETTLGCMVLDQPHDWPRLFSHEKPR